MRRRLESWHLVVIGAMLLCFGLANIYGLLEPRESAVPTFAVLGRFGWAPTLLLIASGVWLLIIAHRGPRDS